MVNPYLLLKAGYTLIQYYSKNQQHKLIHLCSVTGSCMGHVGGGDVTLTSSSMFLTLKGKEHFFLYYQPVSKYNETQYSYYIKPPL